MTPWGMKSEQEQDPPRFRFISARFFDHAVLTDGAVKCADGSKMGTPLRRAEDHPSPLGSTLSGAGGATRH